MAYYLCGYKYHGGKKHGSSEGFIEQKYFISENRKDFRFYMYYKLTRKVLIEKKIKKIINN
jgi:hypothetical protein